MSKLLPLSSRTWKQKGSSAPQYSELERLPAAQQGQKQSQNCLDNRCRTLDSHNSDPTRPTFFGRSPLS